MAEILHVGIKHTWLIVRIKNLLKPKQFIRYRRTDGQTDGRQLVSIARSLGRLLTNYRIVCCQCVCVFYRQKFHGA